LGSGSGGNAALIECGRTAILLDCGFSARETEARLARLGRSPEDLTAIVLTHEHSDHVDGVGACARRFDVPVWMTAGTRAALPKTVGEIPAVHLFHPHEPFTIDDLALEPFPVPHDAREPCQFVFTDGDARLGFITDVGSLTTHIEMMLEDCTALVLECNHDRELLRDGPYAPALKARVASDVGHLSNAQAARLLRRVCHDGLQHVVAAHLSRTNNTAALARAALAEVLGCTDDEVAVADQDAGHDFIELRPCCV
jgi:phosphoribosyl 1,2-cyclic phosphodiesterase